MSTTTLTALRLQHVRSYATFAIELSPNVNIIVGPNASGKTNLLESILLISGSPSFRALYTNVIRHNQPWARIDGELATKKRTLKLERVAETVKRTYELDGQTKHRLQFNDTIPTVVFEPEHMRLLTGSPELRRVFFDTILEELVPIYSKNLQEYRRVLAQRNKLLKLPANTIQQQLFVWNVRLCELAGAVVAERLKLIDKINTQLGAIYSEIAQKPTTATIEYSSPFAPKNYESQLLKSLEQDYKKDLARGFTGAGPHREDYACYLHEQQASTTASRGETRTLVLALKLLELRFLEQSRQSKPLLLLDDVFSELDGARRKALTTYIEPYQTFITTTDADIILKNFAQESNIIVLGS